MFPVLSLLVRRSALDAAQVMPVAPAVRMGVPSHMGDLGPRDYARLLDLAVDLVGSCDSESCWQLVCLDLADALHSSVAGVTKVQLHSGVVSGLMWPPAHQPVDWPTELIKPHPAIIHYANCQDGSPRTVSELAGWSRWRNSAGYAAAHESFDGATNQLTIPLPSPPGLYRSVTVGRPNRDYGAREWAFVNRLQPLLCSLDKRLGAMPQETVERTIRHAMPAFLKITARELAVLELLAQGLLAGSIARQLGISSRTVAKHQENLYRKLGTSDRLTAVLKAQQAGIIGAPATF